MKVEKQQLLKLGKNILRVLTIILMLILLTNGVNNVSKPDDAKVALGLFEITLVICFIVFLYIRITNKINNTIFKQTNQNESKTNH